MNVQLYAAITKNQIPPPNRSSVKRYRVFPIIKRKKPTECASLPSNPCVHVYVFLVQRLIHPRHHRHPERPRQNTHSPKIEQPVTSGVPVSVDVFAKSHTLLPVFAPGLFRRNCQSLLLPFDRMLLPCAKEKMFTIHRTNATPNHVRNSLPGTRVK